MRLGSEEAVAAMEAEAIVAKAVQATPGESGAQVLNQVKIGETNLPLARLLIFTTADPEKNRSQGKYETEEVSLGENGKKIPYLLVHTGDGDFGQVGELAYAVLPAVPGVEYDQGSGFWCLLAQGHRGVDGQSPQHPTLPSVVYKVGQGWVQPAMVKLDKPLALVLRPGAVFADAFQVPLSSDGRDYLLLENRQRLGFDHVLPAEGLLVWRVQVQADQGKRVTLLGVKSEQEPQQLRPLARPTDELRVHTAGGQVIINQVHTDIYGNVYFHLQRSRR